MGIPGAANPLLLRTAAAGGYSISRSLRFNSADSAYLSRTPASAGNRKTWTWAGWVKRVRPTYDTDYLFGAYYGGSLRYEYLSFTTGDKIDWFSGLYSTSSTTESGRKITSAVYRDPSAWYHIVAAKDTTQATAGNRFKLYVNGVQVSLFDTSTDPALNDESFINDSSTPHRVGGLVSTANSNQYLADIHFIDGQALTPTSFGEFDANGIWQPKAYTGTYGTNGFQLKFADNSNNTATTLGKDTSGNGNNWTPNNLSVTAGAGNDSLVDSPTNGTASSGGDAGGVVVGNYCTWNPLNNPATSATLGNGNLEVSANTTAFQAVTGTIFASSGKWYAEFTQEVTATDQVIGIAATTFVPSTANNRYVGRTADSYAIYSDGRKINNNTFTSYGSSWAVGDVLSIALDLDNGKVWFGKNGTWYASGNPASGTNEAFSGISGSFTFACSPYGTGKFVFNAGTRPFAYAAPSGFKSLNTANLPTSTILKGSDYFQTVLYTGNGSSQSISGLAFSPDFVWVKNRTSANDHALFDAIRGIYVRLESNSTGAEFSSTASLTAFNSNGFDVGSSAVVNTSSNAYAAWCWDAGSSNSTNTQGSITSTVRANASAGFSIVTYTGTGANATVGHGGLANLSNGMIIVKNRSSATNWRVYHSALGNTKVIFLSTTGSPDTNSVYWNNTSPTSTVFSVGSDDGVNGNGNSMVAYCFAPVSGYSAFGSYVGNGSATDGPFVYTGFRPKWVLVKRTDAADDWPLMDTARTPANPQNAQLWPNFSNAESNPVASSRQWDALSNGFKIRGDNAAINFSGGTYIYVCFAESPFSIARAR